MFVPTANGDSLAGDKAPVLPLMINPVTFPAKVAEYRNLPEGSTLKENASCPEFANGDPVTTVKAPVEGLIVKAHTSGEAVSPTNTNFVAESMAIDCGTEAPAGSAKGEPVIWVRTPVVALMV